MIITPVWESCKMLNIFPGKKRIKDTYHCGEHLIFLDRGRLNFIEKNKAGDLRILGSSRDPFPTKIGKFEGEITSANFTLEIGRDSFLGKDVGLFKSGVRDGVFKMNLLNYDYVHSGFHLFINDYEGASDPFVKVEKVSEEYLNVSVILGVIIHSYIFDVLRST